MFSAHNHNVNNVKFWFLLSSYLYLFEHVLDDGADIVYRLSYSDIPVTVREEGEVTKLLPKIINLQQL
jgi:hypothetical protein